MPDGDSLEELVKLEGEARQVYRQLTPTEEPDARYDGRDPTGAVLVAVDGAGVVRDVVVDRAWRSRVAAGGLGGAVQQATVEATTARFTAWGDAVADGSDKSRQSALPDMTAGENLSRSMAEAATAPGGVSDERALDELLSMLEQIEESIDTVSEQLEQQVSQTHTGRSPGRHVAVVVNGAGEVVHVEYDERWLDSAHETNIGRETHKAFQAAYEFVGRHSLQRLIAASPLGEIQRLAGDPDAVARRLGMRLDGR